MKKIVIIGGGYGGLRAAEILSKTKDEDLEILVIDKNLYHYLQTEVYGFIAGKYNFDEITIDLEHWSMGFSNVNYLQANILKVDEKENYIMSEDGDKIDFDYLIVAAGALTHINRSIDGLREHCFGVKKLNSAYDFRREVETLIYSKLQGTDDNSSKPKSCNIVIGGAGLSGVEIAAELGYVLRKYGKVSGKNIQNIQIYLLNRSKTILPGMSDFLISSSTKRLKKLGVHLYLNKEMKKVDDTHVYCSDGEKLPYKFIIFTGGIKAFGLNKHIDIPKNNINQFIVDDYLNICNSQHIFAIGDCAEINNLSGEWLPPTAQVAEAAAAYAAKNIQAQLNNEKPDKFDMKIHGMFVALGGKYGAGELFGFKVNGYIGYLFKRAITVFYNVGLHLHINTGFKKRNHKES